ncbi:MAG: MoaD family protein [Methanotrichaceae archaeon]|nr:MoaD family protein [Methanotrichaceae archaeon]
MLVRLKAFAGFRHILGKERAAELAEGSRVSDLLQRLCEEHPELRPLLYDGSTLKPEVNILVKGVNIEGLQGPDTVLAEGDEVAVFPAAIGG